MTARADALERLPLLAAIATRQSSVLSRHQLGALGVDRDAVAGQKRARRWREPVPGVLVLHLGPLDHRSRCWLAVLAGGSASALCAWTALELFGLVGWERIAHRKLMILGLADIEGGSRAMSEIDLVRLCRSAGLPVPTRQRMRLDRAGRRRYLDAEWELRDGTVLALEVDGVHHVEVGQWYSDLLREAELDLPGRRRVIRLPAMALRLEPQRVVAILAQSLSMGQYQRGA